MRLLVPALVLLAACPAADDDRPSDGKDDATDDDVQDACLQPTWSAPHTLADATVRVQVGPKDASPADRFRMRPVVLDQEGDADGTVRVEVGGKFRLYDVDGTPLTAPVDVDASDLPRTLLVSALRDGTGGLTATPLGVPAGADCAPTSLPLASTGSVELAGRVVTGDGPPVRQVDLFREDEPVSALLDPSQLDDRIGVEADVYVVRHRTAAEWDEDPALDDVSGGAETATVGDGAPLSVWPLGAGGARGGNAHPRDYDVVVDWGRDGQLDPGDLVDGLDRSAGFWIARDLSQPGPYTPEKRRYNAGGEWLQQEVWFPTDLPVDKRPAPLVVISHGNGHDYTWYGFIGSHLASYGFVVMSHTNDTGPGILTASRTTLQNTDVLITQADTVLDGALAGLIDVDNLGWVGHSRGGEGVVRALQRLRGNAEAYTPVTLSADKVRAVVSIAPTVFDGARVKANPGDVPYLLLVGGSDGDVTGGADCPLCQSMRIAGVAEGDVGMINFHGASHNVFHDGVGSFEDGVGPNQRTRAEIHPAELTYLLSFFGWELMGIDGYREVFTRGATQWRPLGVPDDLTVAVSWREPIAGDTWWIDTFQDDGGIETASCGGTVTATDVTVTEALADDGDTVFGWSNGRDVSNGMTVVSRDGWERAAILTWATDATYTVTLPDPLDVSGFRELALRAAQVTRAPETRTHAGPLGFSLTLVDASGGRATLPASDYAVLTDPYPRGGSGEGTGWGNEWSSVRVPMVDFGRAGVDLSAITAVELTFGSAHGAGTGRIGLDDLGFAP